MTQPLAGQPGPTTEPRVYCAHCGRYRLCRFHLRAEFPPKAARRWLAKNDDCDAPDHRYVAGLIVGRRIVR
jgi:hypothetical protein